MLNDLFAKLVAFVFNTVSLQIALIEVAMSEFSAKHCLRFVSEPAFPSQIQKLLIREGFIVIFNRICIWHEFARIVSSSS